MGIYPEPDDISRYRREFLNNGTIDMNVVRLEIAESWKRSAAYGINAESNILPNKGNIDKKYIKAGRARYNYATWLYYFFDAANTALNELGGAEVCVDNNLTVTLIIGDPVMIQELSDKGLKVGTNLAESRIGTNAMALAYAYGREVWVSGDEHYIEALRDYVCAASWWQPPITSNYSAYSSMIVIPKERYLPGYRSIVHLFIGAQETFKLLHQQPLNIMRGELIDLLMDRSTLGYLIVDSNGAILQYNESVFDYIGNNITTEKSDYLNDCYPPLAYVTQYSKSNRADHVKILHWETPAGDIKVALHPMWTSKKSIGTIILISSASSDSLLESVKGPQDTSQDKKHQQINDMRYRANYTFDDIFSADNVFFKQIENAKKAASSRSNVLITGESGTGKAMLAQSIHNASDRRGKPFVTINCAAIPNELFSSELFGYTEGIYTGARKYGASGKIEDANGGTLHLDEVGELPLDVQALLLAALEERKVSRLGEPTQTPIDIRVIASSSKNLYELIVQKQFRLDLFYFLNVLSADLPPLRERPSDINLLATRFINELSAPIGKKIKGISPDIMNAFREYAWPGNVLELKNMVERCINVTSSDTISLDDLPSGFMELSRLGAFSKWPAYSKRSRSRPAYDRDLVVKLLEEYADNKTRVCDELGISRPTLYRKLKKWGLYDNPYDDSE